MRRLIAGAAAVALGAAASPASAHGGHVHAAEAPGWSFAPLIVVPLLLVAGLYLLGLVRLRQRAGRGRALLRPRALRFWAGWAILAGALVSPLHEGGERSFALHMIEHELIMLPAALLLVIARPGPVLLWGLPEAWRKALGPLLRWHGWRTLSAPAMATAIQALALVAWHMPALFDRALRSDAWHIAQHASFVVSALLFWRAVMPEHDRAGAGLFSAICLFVTSMVGSGLGALMALAGSPWYPAYAAMGLSPLGLTPEQDQQLAGLIMWVPGGLFHLGAALLLLARWLRADQARTLSAST